MTMLMLPWKLWAFSDVLNTIKSFHGHKVSFHLNEHHHEI